MTRSLYVLFLLCCWSVHSTGVKAQVANLVVTPLSQTVVVSTDSFQVRAFATVRNTSNRVRQFRWTRIIGSMTGGWQCLVCDKKTCYPYGSERFQLAPGETMRLDVAIRPNRLSGHALVDVKIVEINKPEATTTFKVAFSGIAAPRLTPKAINELNIYPNPATDYFMLNDNEIVDKVVIYNIIGRQVRNYKAYDNIRYSLNDLPEGTYIIRLLAANGATLKTIKLNKNRVKA